MPKLSFTELQNCKQIDLFVRPKHVRGNTCHSGDNCPAARAARDMIDEGIYEVWAMPTLIQFQRGKFTDFTCRPVYFSSKKLQSAISRFDGGGKFPTGTYRLKRQ